MKTTEERIKEYFDSAKAKRGEFADWHIAAAKQARWDSQKKTHEREAWLHGVYMQAVLDDMEKDMVRIIRQAELAATV